MCGIEEGRHRCRNSRGRTVDARSVAVAAVFITSLLLAFKPASVFAQDPDASPYQLIGFSAGWGAVRPAQDPPFDGAAADGETSLQLAMEIEMRQAPMVFLFARLSTDVAPIRQHVAFSGGVRVRPMLGRRFQPYAGGGLVLYWLVPSDEAARDLERLIVPGATGALGVETVLIPRIRGFAEYRLKVASFMPVGSEGCDRTVECLVRSDQRVLHAGQSLLLGFRMQTM